MVSFLPQPLFPDFWIGAKSTLTEIGITSYLGSNSWHRLLRAYDGFNFVSPSFALACKYTTGYSTLGSLGGVIFTYSKRNIETIRVLC